MDQDISDAFVAAGKGKGAAEPGRVQARADQQ